MYNHAPKNYKCPICLAVSSIENEDTLIKQTDIVYKDKLVTIFISSFHLHPIIVPNEHFENLYDLPDEYLIAINLFAKKTALALKKTTNCEGITILQNNELASDQHAFHYHLHVLARYENDDLLNRMAKKKDVPSPEERAEYALKLKPCFKPNRL
jgi:histidine triad (HIT) family protein